MLCREALPPLKVGNKEVCSISRRTMTSSCRVPQPQIDGQVVYRPDESRHMVVAHNCQVVCSTVSMCLIANCLVLSTQFFEVDMFQPNSNTLLSPPQLYRQLEEVIAMSPESTTPPVSERVGLLTTNDRDTWAEARQRLAAGVWMLLCCGVCDKWTATTD